MTSLILTNVAVIGAIMLLLWLISLAQRDVSIVDLFWGIGFAVIATATAIQSPTSVRQVVLAALVSVWGLRLAAYLAWRNLGKPEDYRYAAMREKFGARFSVISLVVVFGLQGMIMLIVALPVQLGMQSASPLGWLDFLGMALWTCGFLCETVGDLQLARFKAQRENKGRVMNRGLWRYTRHPNYFGDFLIWWGIFIIGLAGGSPWWTIVSPLLMSFLLIRVSGVALLEKHLAKRLEGYQQYLETTSSFFPWFPRSSK